MRTTAAVVIAMAVGVGAWAGEPPARAAQAGPGAAGAQWDDSHMQSRHGETRTSARPRISGQSGYGALASGSAEPSEAQVKELEFTTQREWEMGKLSTNSRERAKAAASASKPSGSPRPTRGSELRGNAFTSGSHH
jgi:hypothetical protein